MLEGVVIYLLDEKEVETKNKQPININAHDKQNVHQT